MKTQASIWIVAALLVTVVGIVYALTGSTPPHQNTARTIPVSEAPKPSKGPQLAASAKDAPVSLSPDLSRTDSFEFLDPVPLGQPAPNVSATTADGKLLRLADFKGKKNVVVVFYQGSFCSVCGAQLSNIQSHLSYFKEQDAEVIAVSADDATHAMRSLGEHGLTFNVVPDPDKKMIQAFGVGNISKRNIAWPSLFVIDKQGIVRLNFASREGHRMHSNEILPVLSKITGKPAPRLAYDD